MKRKMNIIIEVAIDDNGQDLEITHDHHTILQVKNPIDLRTELQPVLITLLGKYVAAKICNDLF